ncbi:hypothetical protein H9W90_05020 [Polaribacter pectinis]|uniref:HTH luxR-type domain-containing protein n=1 Tax=Polaribacter pectinis TaxID=2738844 RepID=A0A7G9LCY6_9FLAO|nr:7TM diverse intracellular signaling domain-containing protein [Polaribacter pectinis]QNM86485.1 hypothetical protein H9W90_05020 [Polaribacter pectinis]
MQKQLLYIFLFLWFGISFSQTDIYFVKDSENIFNKESIKNADFNLLKNEISEGYNNATYWFKIPAYKTDKNYIFRVTYDRYTDAIVYQNSNIIEKLNNQRYLTYRFSRENDVYIKIKSKLHSYIPIEFDTEEASFVNQKHQLIFNCFYYGVAFFIILYNFFYFFLFKEDTFLYYSLFLGFTCLGIFSMDGMLNFYNISEALNRFIVTLSLVLLTYFSAKFASSYLFLDRYYPKIKRISYSVGGVIIVVAILFLIFNNYYYLLTLNVLVFLLLFIYWVVSILLFNKSFYNKILTVAYVLLLFSSIDFFILKFIGLSIIDIDSITIKIGAFFEMIILSIAVLYRMKVLRDDNYFMKQEIINYSKEIKNLSEEISEEKEILNQKLASVLSIREDEIFKLIVDGKSNKEIGTLLNISVNTVKFHIKNIYEKLNIKSRKEVLVIAKSQH